ncbi:hypothetical protein OQA88_1350 [Cercophora sp. LCS_1]
MSYGYGGFTLRSGTDAQLATSFSREDWAKAANTAKQRNRVSKDPYIEAVRICAESKIGGADAECALLAAVDELSKTKDPVDIDTVDLYEYFVQDFLDSEIEYADTLGPLRAKWVKDNPKNDRAIECMRTCLEYGDVGSAQGIALALDKAFSKSATKEHRKYTFWSITLTLLLSTDPRSTDQKRNVFRMLAIRRLEKAADATEEAAKAADTASEPVGDATKVDPASRDLLSEEEICLFYRALFIHGTRDAYIQRLQSPYLGAVALLQKGHKLLFWEALDILETWGNWDLIFELCQQGLKLGADGTTPPFFVCDWKVWKMFIHAASKNANPESALAQVRSILKSFLALDAKTAAMYKKNLSLALLELTFALEGADEFDPGSNGLSARAIQVGLFLEQYFDKLSAFDDVRNYVEDLGFEEARCLVKEILPRMLDAESQKAKKVILKSLTCKIRYLLATCPQTVSRYPSMVKGQQQTESHQCRFCSSLTAFPCRSCLKQIIGDSADVYRQITADKDIRDSIPHLDKDPRIDLSLVIGTSLLKLAELQAGNLHALRSPLHDVDSSLFLQSTLILDTQLKRTPSDNSLRLLLVQLYLLLGNASYAQQLWAPLDVKRTIQDALSPLFFDRISTISPALFQGARPLLEPLVTYYNNTIGGDCPLKIWDAYSYGSYTSILDMVKYDDKLRRSCTLFMTLVEEYRAARLFGTKMNYEISDHPLTWRIKDDTTLLNKTDYGSFPNLESKHVPQIQEYTRLGPGLSNERAHISFLAEQYAELLAYKPPKEYKPAKAFEAAMRDREYVLERLERINNSITNFLHQPATPPLLTNPETTYYHVVSLLTSILLTSLSTTRADPKPESLPRISSAIRSTLASLRKLTLQPSPKTMPLSLFAMTDFHTVAYLRETALVVKHSAAFVLAFHERELARDRSGKSALHKDVVAEMKALETVATKTLGETKTHVQKLKEALNEGGWLDKMLDWTFGSQEEGGDEAYRDAVSDIIGGPSAAEEWVGDLLTSWRDNIKGWLNVRWE